MKKKTVRNDNKRAAINQLIKLKTIIVHTPHIFRVLACFYAELLSKKHSMLLFFVCALDGRVNGGEKEEK